jgi:hypothetical protein
MSKKTKIALLLWIGDVAKSKGRLSVAWGTPVFSPIRLSDAKNGGCRQIENPMGSGALDLAAVISEHAPGRVRHDGRRPGR